MKNMIYILSEHGKDIKVPDIPAYSKTNTVLKARNTKKLEKPKRLLQA